MTQASSDSRQFGEALFHLLVQTVEDYAIFAMDAEGRIVHWNAGAARTTGYAEEEVLGKPLTMIFTPEQIAAGLPEQELATAAETGRAEDERWHVRKDGARFWALGVVVPLRGPDGALRGFGKILRDRTDLKQLQESLKARADLLAEGEQRKNVFLATLSHELRNMLAPLANCVHILRQQGPRVPTPTPLVEMMERQIHQLRRLVDDLLDVTRITQGRLALSKERVDLARLVAQTAESMRAEIEASGLDFHVLLPAYPIAVDADFQRLQQVLVNLLHNSRKFTPEGGQVAVTLETEEPEAVIRVRDTGIGISAAEIERIFELFTQADGVREQRHAGLGIGLSLVRDLVALHGGTVQATSPGEGKGSEFTVRLPLASAVPAQ
jgi:PAS domain S-box-containing protein